VSAVFSKAEGIRTLITERVTCSASRLVSYLCFQFRYLSPSVSNRNAHALHCTQAGPRCVPLGSRSVFKVVSITKVVFAA
jgi:hypothetical protein